MAERTVELGAYRLRVPEVLLRADEEPAVHEGDGFRRVVLQAAGASVTLVIAEGLGDPDGVASYLVDVSSAWPGQVTQDTQSFHGMRFDRVVVAHALLDAAERLDGRIEAWACAALGDLIAFRILTDEPPAVDLEKFRLLMLTLVEGAIVEHGR